MTDNFNEAMEQEMENVVVLTDEEGNEVSFEYIDMFEYDGKEYVVLMPMDENDESGEVVILELIEGKTEEEDDELLSVEDEGILDAVFEMFKEKYKEFIDFQD